MTLPQAPQVPPLTADECAPVLRALAEPVRLRIISVLREGPLCVADVMARLDLRQYQASRHLAALHELGVLTRERQGRRVLYALSEQVRRETKEAPTVELGCCRVCVE